MTPRRSLRDKRKRRIDETYDITLFDSYKHALRFLNFESRIVQKYVGLEDLGDLDTNQ